MTLSSTLSAAISGLGATSRAAKVVSSNIANAMNENYGRRELEITGASYVFNGGVRVEGIRRHVDPALLADRRSASAESGLHSERAATLSRLESVLGQVDSPSSISGRMRQLIDAVSFAESDPSSSVRLQNVVDASGALVTAFNDAQSQIKSLREQADHAIFVAVETINSSLAKIEDLNQKIVSASVNGHDISGFLDQRQQLIDTVAEQVPLREMPRQHGAVSLVTKGGALLLEQSAATIHFDRTHTIMPHMTMGSGDLGHLTIDDQSFDFQSSAKGMSGGRLESLFESRDQIAQSAQSDLDGLAFEVASRFQSSSVDPTISSGFPGLFTDDGNFVDLGNSIGLAGRMTLNSAVDPSLGGQVWRVRDGMEATNPGPAGNASIFGNFIDVLTVPAPTTAASLPYTGSLLDLATSVASASASEELIARQNQTISRAHLQQTQDMMFDQGVDTDSEMQRLLMIETNYAANARVIQAVESMLDDLLRIGS